MSANKLNYYLVTTTSVVTAKNQGDAISLTQRARNVEGRVMANRPTAKRIPAAQAKLQARKVSGQATA